MAEFSDLVTATKAVVDPSTSAADLAQIAQLQPSLRPQVAAHPNAYPALLQWLDANDGVVAEPPVVPPQTVSPASGEVTPAVVAEASRPSYTPETALQGSPALDSAPVVANSKNRKVLFGVLGGVVAVVVIVLLVVTLIVLPNQRAAQAAAAAASASAQAAQELQDATAAFNTASTACMDANTALASAISSAQQAAQTDPSTMQDPTLIDKLNQAITTAQAVQTCTAPTMAGDTATIQQQTTQLGTDTQTVTSATSTLTSATQAVPASVQAKQDAAAQAAAEAATKTQRGSFTVTSDEGYVYAFSWTGVQVTATVDPTQGAPGTLVLQYSATGSVTVTNETPGKQAPQPWLELQAIYPQSSGELFCPPRADQVTPPTDVVLGGQNVSLMDCYPLNGGVPYLSSSPGRLMASLPTLDVGASVTESLTVTGDESVTFGTSLTADQLVAEFEGVAGWGAKVLVPMAEGGSVGYGFQYLATSALSCAAGSHLCFLGVSDSLAGG